MVGPDQHQLIQEIEHLGHQLQRLSRRQRDAPMANISRRLRESARDLRRFQSSVNHQEAQMYSQRALERLTETATALSRQRRKQLSQDIQALKADSRQLMEEQEEVVPQLNRLSQHSQPSQLNHSLLKELYGVLHQQSEQQKTLLRLEGNLHEAARLTASKQPIVSRRLKKAALNIRDQETPMKMQQGVELLSRGWTYMARELAEEVHGDLQALSKKIQQAAEEAFLPSSPFNQSNQKEGLQDALTQLGVLLERLPSLKERTSQNHPGQGHAPSARRSWEDQPTEGEGELNSVTSQPSQTPQIQLTERTTRAPRSDSDAPGPRDGSHAGLTSSRSRIQLHQLQSE